MVNAALVSGLLSLASGQLGFVRAVEGQATMRSNDAGASLTAGAPIRSGAAIETGPGAWTELLLEGGVRVRVSASSSLAVHDGTSTRVSLDRGRAVVTTTSDPVEIESWTHRVRADVRSLVVFETTPGGNLVVAVRRGHVRVRTSKREDQAVPGGEVVTLSASADRVLQPKIGGSGFEELAETESRRHWPDRIGFSSFIFSVLKGGELPPASTPALRDLAFGAAEVLGPEGGAGGALLENALRPLPFFEDEVPPKGPNVRVEVSFHE